MAEVNTAEADKAVALVEAGFAQGFGDTPPAVAEKVVEAPKVDPVPQKPAEAAPAAKPVVVPEKPKYAKVLQHDFDNLKAAAGKVSSLESQIARMAQTMGNTDQLERRIVDKIRAQTPLGLNVELSDEDFADMAAEFPELAKLTRSSLEKAFKKAGVRGTGQAEAPRGVDVEKEVQKVLLERDKQSFEEEYPTWSDIVGRPPTPGAEAVQTDFRKWLATQPADYQKKINETESWREIHKALDKFASGQTTAPAPQAKPDRAAARRAVMEDAVTPRTDGAAPPLVQPQSAEEAFGDSFKKAKRH